MRVLAIGVAVFVVAVLAYIRLSPIDPDRWHQPIVAQSDAVYQGGAVRVFDARSGDLARVDAAARALPRTSVLAGSVAQMRVTYVTRSTVFGFPDLTTIEQQGDTLRMYARLRFGVRDFGVNAARLRELARALD